MQFPGQAAQGLLQRQGVKLLLGGLGQLVHRQLPLPAAQLGIADVDQDPGEPGVEELRLTQLFAGAEALVDRLVHRVHRGGLAAQVQDGGPVQLLLQRLRPADVFLFASDQLIELVDAGAIAQLGGDAEKLVKETIADSVRATAMVGDATYAIPFTHNTFFMFYDKTIMSEDDVTSLEKIMAKETADNVYNYYFESSGGWKLGAYYYGAGLTVFGPEGNDLEAGVNWNNATGVAVTNYLIDLINNPKCAYDGEIAVSELIEDHRLGVWFDGSWNYETYKNILGDDMGIGVIPTFNPDGNDYQLLGFYGSKCIGVNAHSKNMAAAVAFATYLGNEENQMLRYQKSAQVPTNITAGASTEVISDPLAAVIVKESNEASVMQPSHSVFSSRYWTYAGAIPTEIRSGEINKDNVQEKLDTFVKAMTE